MIISIPETLKYLSLAPEKQNKSNMGLQVTLLLGVLCRGLDKLFFNSKYKELFLRLCLDLSVCCHALYSTGAGGHLIIN